MKRLLVLTSLSLTAVFLITSVSIGATIPRATPGVTSSTTPKKDSKRPYTFTTKGRIVLPTRLCAPNPSPTSVAGGCIPVTCSPGVTDPRYCSRPTLAQLCTGKVNIRFQRRGRTLSSRNVNVKADCTFSGKATFRSKARSQRGTLRVRSRFQGNQILAPKASTTKSVRAGR